MKIVVFGIHPDDIELGCGGTAALCLSQGHGVVLADLTRGECSSNGTPEQRERESQEAARLLGCDGRENLGLPDAGLRGDDPGQQRAVVSFLRAQRPDLVIVPSGDDPHPDHASGGELIERALYLAGIGGYNAENGNPAWKFTQGLVYPGRRDVQADIVVDVSSTFRTKMAAIRAHRSQFDLFDGAENTPLNDPGFLTAVEARASAYGYRIGVRYGEPFALMNPQAIVNLSSLVRKP
jgi:bacillithiol biosynthesis deacetylase BshB1